MGAKFIDFSKAFDMVAHTTLKNILTRKGIKEKTGDWVSHFLLSQKQWTIVNGATLGEE